MKYLSVMGGFDLKFEKNSRKILFIFMLGFFCGILYTNMISEGYVMVTNVFHENFLREYSNLHLVSWEYMMYLTRKRLLPLLFLAVAGVTKGRKPMAILFVSWTGFSAGVLAVTAVLRMGSAGMLFCIAALFPHFLFYIISYFMILWYLFGYPKISWNRTKTIFIAFMYFTGIVSEAYLNPQIIGFLLDLFF